MVEYWEEFTLLTLMTKITKKLSKCEEKIGKTFGSSHAVQKESSDQHHEGGCEAGSCIPTGSKNYLWLYSGISWIHKATSGIFSTHKIALQAKVLCRWPITIWFTNLFPCFKQWRFRMQKLQWTRNGRSSKRLQHGNWRKSRVKRWLFWKYTETQNPLCYIKVESCSVVTS